MKDKIKVLMVCHGNICRSPMAEFVMKDIVKRAGENDNFYIDSAATSTEEIGNGIHHGTRRILQEKGIPCTGHRAVQMTRADYDKYDYLIGMDEANIRNMLRIAGGDGQKKMYMLLSFAGKQRAIADPWYTGDFDTTYADVKEGCEAFFTYLKKKEK
ncbi:MAG: low molecular weight protein-tyrosine-phosphatase [Lachnospiraceae bacterium]|nr:low molecular weight protein-tyrosine-phosphatase [Lachnospiraceae bacterium]